MFPVVAPQRQRTPLRKCWFLPLGYFGSVGCTCRTLYGVVGHHPEKLFYKAVPGLVTIHEGQVAMGIHPVPCGVNSVPLAWPD